MGASADGSGGVIVTVDTPPGQGSSVPRAPRDLSVFERYVRNFPCPHLLSPAHANAVFRMVGQLMFKRGAFVANVLIGVGLDPAFSTVTRRLAPEWKSFACERSGASRMIEEFAGSTRRMVVMALTPADTNCVTALADRYPREIDGVILRVGSDQADEVGEWCRQTKFNGLCKVRADDAEDMTRSLSTMLANVETFGSRGTTPGRLIQLR